jgi:hypothetical protein
MNAGAVGAGAGTRSARGAGAGAGGPKMSLGPSSEVAPVGTGSEKAGTVNSRTSTAESILGSLEEFPL